MQRSSDAAREVAAEGRPSDLLRLPSGGWPRTRREAVVIGLALHFALNAP